MASHDFCGGHALGIAFGITMLVLLLAGGAAAATLTDPTNDIFIWSSGSSVSGPSYIDIVSAEITQVDSTNITLKIKVNGDIPSFGWQGYYFYLDTDKSSTTGFSNIGSNDIGVDYEVGVRGNSGSPPIFAEIRKDGVAQGSGIPINYTVSGDTISTTISLADIGNPTSFYWIALTTDGVSINDKAPNSGHGTFSDTYFVPSPTSWTKYSGNPLNLENGAYFPSVIFDGTNYKMWYALNDEIYYATSIDGVTWIKYGKVLSKGAPGSWEQTVIRPQTVIYDGSIYKMWYEGSSAMAQLKIGYATSSDGITWTKYSGNPVLSPGANGGWDDWSLSDASVIKDSSTYKMWYSAQSVQYGTSNIGYATSSDGITWTKYGSNPVVLPGANGGWDDKHVYHQAVLKDNTGYKMWYIGLDSSDIGRIGYATSSDGIAWTKYSGNPVLDLGNNGTWDDANLNGPFVLFNENANNMWYGGYDGSFWKIGFASTSGVVALRVHNINKGTDYSTIQSAIDGASPGDEIHVDSGTYYENVNVNKQLVLRGVDTGGGKPVVDAGGNGNAIELSADWITLEGFTATNSSYLQNLDAGIKITSNNNVLRNNIVISNYFGIYLNSSSSNTITGNNFNYNNWAGIRLEYSSYNIITDNSVSHNTRPGIRLYSSSHNTISNNFVDSNIRKGISLSDSSDYNTITGNNVSNNMLSGININSSVGNILYKNNISNNDIAGIDIENPTEIQANAYDDNTNQWDNGIDTGNHHSNYDESSEGCNDANSNGICDSAYNIPGGSSVDRYPITGALSPCGNTPTGQNVETVPVSNLNLSFDSVLSCGATTATAYQNNQWSPLPGNYSPVQFYDIGTTATYSSYITVKVTYPGVPSNVNENSLRLFHYEGGSWVDVTTALDTASKTITGRVASLSPFSVAGTGGGSGSGGGSGGSGGSGMGAVAPSFGTFGFVILSMCLVTISILRLKRKNK